MIIKQRAHSLVTITDETVPGHVSIIPFRVVYWYAPNGDSVEVPIYTEYSCKSISDYTLGDCLNLIVRLRDKIYQKFIVNAPQIPYQDDLRSAHIDFIEGVQNGC